MFIAHNFLSPEPGHVVTSGFFVIMADDLSQEKNDKNMI